MSYLSRQCCCATTQLGVPSVLPLLAINEVYLSQCRQRLPRRPGNTKAERTDEVCLLVKGSRRQIRCAGDTVCNESIPLAILITSSTLCTLLDSRSTRHSSNIDLELSQASFSHQSSPLTEATEIIGSPLPPSSAKTRAAMLASLAVLLLGSAGALLFAPWFWSSESTTQAISPLLPPANMTVKNSSASALSLRSSPSSATSTPVLSTESDTGVRVEHITDANLRGGQEVERRTAGGCYFCSEPGWTGQCGYALSVMGTRYSMESWTWTAVGFGPDEDARCFIYRYVLSSVCSLQDSQPGLLD